jgi:hypothetical protein
LQIAERQTTDTEHVQTDWLPPDMRIVSQRALGRKPHFSAIKLVILKSFDVIEHDSLTRVLRTKAHFDILEFDIFRVADVGAPRWQHTKEKLLRIARFIFRDDAFSILGSTSARI